MDRLPDPGAAVTGVLVVGMHRSGTTAVTRTINLMGVPTCVESDLAPGWIGNPAGHWESLTLMRTDDALLREVGAAWWCPPPVEDGLWASPRIRHRRSGARADFDAVHPTPQWVAKDPRLCITLPFWREALDRPLVGILVTRDPLEIASSHASRDGFPLAFGLALWERYLQHTLRALAGLPVLVARYDALLDDPAVWMDTAAAFLNAHGVTAAAADASGVVDSSLRHEERGQQDESVLSGAQRDLAALVDGVSSASMFEQPALPEETPTTGPMFEQLRRRRGIGRRWRWRRYLNRDRNALVVD